MTTLVLLLIKDNAIKRDSEKERNDKVFGTRGLTNLQNGCRWFANWFEVANSPEVKYREFKCPEAIVKRSGVDRRGLNDIVKSCF